MFKQYFQRYILGTFLFIISLMIVSLLCRFVFIVNTGYLQGAFGGKVEIYDIIHTLFNGMRYDGRVIAFSAIGYTALFLIFIWSAKRVAVLTIFSSVFAFIIILLSICNIGYYAIYGDTFNAVILGMIYDDRSAILMTAQSGDYNIIFRTLCVIVFTAFFIFAYSAISKRIESLRVKPLYGLVIAFFVLIYSCALIITSTFNLKGGSLDYLITPSKNHFLRKAAPGALRDIYLVYVSHQTAMSKSFESYSKGVTPRAAAEIYFERKFDGTIDMESLLTRNVISGTDKKYKHIFLIMAESLSDWHFNDKYDGQGLVSGMKRLIAEPNGIRIPHFIENAEGTIGALDTILTGLYVTDVPLSGRVGMLQDFAMSLSAFKRLGYSTNFFYFGSGTWRKVDTYVLTQGIDKVYSLSDMPDARRGVWGVYDGEGFDFVAQTVDESPDEPTFNLILTTSNHPPYDVPLAEFCAPLEEMQKYLEENKPNQNFRDKLTPNIMAHIWYSDKQITRFIKQISETSPDSLIIVTGDHYDRYYPEYDINITAANSVLFIVYGRDVAKATVLTTSGAQIDIVPTILELAAPKGFKYKAFGRPLLSSNGNVWKESDVSLGYFAMVNERMLAMDNETVHYFNGAEPTPSDSDYINRQIMRLKMGKALSWYMINKGYIIP